jgi:hypothetical protein
VSCISFGECQLATVGHGDAWQRPTLYDVAASRGRSF